MSQSKTDSLSNLLLADEIRNDVETQYSLLGQLVNIDPQEAINISLALYEHHELKKNKAGKAITFHIAGSGHNLLSQTDSAIFYLEKALELSQEVDDKIYEGRVTAALSAVYIKEYQLSKAQQILQKGLIISEEIGNQSLQLICSMNMAVVFTYLKELDAAENQLKNALELAQQLENQTRIGQIYGNLGNLEFDRANYSLAREYHLKALQVFKELGSEQLIAIIYIQLGRCSDALKNYILAIEYFDRASEIRFNSNDERGLLSINRYKAMALFNARKYNQARNLVESIWDQGLQVNDYFIIKDLAEIRYQMEELQGDQAEALEFFKAYVAAKDSVDTRNAEQEVKRLRAEFENEQLSKALTAEKQLKEIAELKQGQRELYLLIALLLLMALAIIFWLNRTRLKNALIINQQKSELLNQQLQVQSEQLEKAQTEKTQLEATFAQSDENRDKLIDMISGSKIEPSHWASFKLLFNKIYPGFIDKFNQYELTLNDHRLLALIMLGLTPKEIASVLSITPKSVSKAKSRLSQKFGLEQTKDLEGFILS